MNNTEKWLNKNEKKIKIIAGIAIILILLRLVVYAYYRGKSFREHPKYTIAAISSDFHYRKTGKGSGYDYTYTINGKKYEGTNPKGYFKKGETYLIVYDSTFPKSSILFEKINVTDSTYTLPQNGWNLRDIPFKVDTLAIKEEVKKIW